MNKKNKSIFSKIIRPCFLIILIFSFLVTAFLATAEARRKIIQFLPVDEKIENVSWAGNAEIGEVECDNSDWIRKDAYCGMCLGYFETNCDSCCITNAEGSAAETGQQRAMKCTPEASDEYSCSPQAFRCEATDYDDLCDANFENCESDSPPNCQEKGCPDISYQPDYTLPDSYCILDPDNSTKWYCADSNNQPLDALIPEDRGCEPLEGVEIDNYDRNFHRDSSSSESFYTIEKIEGTSIDSNIRSELETELEMDSGALDAYYQYKAKDGYRFYIEECINYTNEQQRCEKGIYCCKLDTCNGDYANNCSCDNLINEWDFNPGTLRDSEDVKKCCGQGGEVDDVNCDANYLTAADCGYFGSEADIVTSCKFKKIVEDFNYRFVPKTGESFVFQWTVNLTTDSGGASTDRVYFYTRLKIHDETTDDINDVYWTPVHQKGFTGSFTVFSGVARENDLDPFKPGHTYEVSIYYFIPDIDDDGADGVDAVNNRLSARVTNLSLNLFRTRE